MAIFNNSDIFGQTTPGNSMKWEFTEPEQNTFTFSDGEETITLAKATDKKVRCHNLVWTAELPTWVSGGSWTNETLSAVMQTHITKEIEAYGDGCYSWDVVNEALSGSGYTSNVFLDVIGEAYVPLAFQYAEAAVKNAGLSCKLVYNDFGIESPGEKNAAAVAMIKKIQAQGIQIDGVGFESHFSTSYYPTTSDQMTAMKAFTDLGLYVQVTELDVACSSASPDPSELAIQAQAYYDTVSACMQTENCTGMTVWDFDDQYSWIQPSTNDGEGAADLFTADLSPKPAVTAVSEAIEGESCSVCS
ncbi:glycoside hydrolase family 10 protein [Acidomyces richmondensis BFW]|nr:MAG: glycoside hydrolase family 10 protein [Acidomyces sp. 'richmondensis']KYG42800.1 glycoside hydrolase family 10 protein [Acidomyces richmondensis BFW]